MARKGVLAPKVALVETMKNGTPRCQFVKAPKKDPKTGKPVSKYGEQCKNGCVPGRPRCKYHGGKAGRPVETGRYSIYNPVPRGLQEKFEKAAQDPEILNLTKNIALLDAQMWSLADEAKGQTNFTPRQTKRLMAIMKQHKELVAQEHARRKDMGTMVPVEDVMLMIRFIYDSMVKNVPDKMARARIGNDLRMIVQSKATAGIVRLDTVTETKE